MRARSDLAAFYEIEPRYVPRPRRQIAERVARAHCARLGLPIVDITWVFALADVRRDLLAWTKAQVRRQSPVKSHPKCIAFAQIALPGRICVAASEQRLPLDEVVEAVAHELKHLEQLARGARAGCSSRIADELEDEALDYGRQASLYERFGLAHRN